MAGLWVNLLLLMMKHWEHQWKCTINNHVSYEGSKKEKRPEDIPTSEDGRHQVQYVKNTYLTMGIGINSSKIVNE